MLSEKWILGFFHSDGSGSTMSGIHHRFIGQHKQAAADVLYQFVEIASGQVGTANAALKQHVARKHAVIGLAVIYQAARRVARHVNSLQLAVAEGDDITVVQISAQGHRFFLQLESEHAALLGSLINPELVCFVGFGRQPEFFQHKRIAEYMV